MASGGQAGWDRVVDDLYAFAADPAVEPDLARSLSAVLRGTSLALWSFDPASAVPPEFLVNSFDPGIIRAYVAHYHLLDPWAARVSGGPPGRILHGAQLIEERAVAKGAFYNEFGIQAGIFHVLGSTMRLPLHAADRRIAALAVHRPRQLGAFDEADAAAMARLLPHVQRALQLRLQFGRSLAGVQAGAIEGMLEAIGSAAVVTDGAGRVRHANGAAAALDRGSSGLRLRGGPGGTIAAAPAANGLLHAALAAAARGGAGGSVRLALPSGEALLALASPLPRHMAELAGAKEGLALLVLRPLGVTGMESLRRAAAKAFGLAPAEAAVAAALASGMSPKEIALARKVQVSTVRTLLERAQAKAEVADLRQLVRVLSALSA